MVLKYFLYTFSSTTISKKEIIWPYSQNVYMTLLQMSGQVPYKWPDRNP